MAGFVRSHGLGNDYLVADPARIPFALGPAVVRMLCDRHTGVGSDGLLVLLPSTRADFGLRIFNPDGSEAEKSGNGVRIAAKFVREHGYTAKDRFALETKGGVVRVELAREGERVVEVVAWMGKARFGAPVAIDVDGRPLEVTALSLGNPHCVVVVPDLAAVDVRALGPRIERHPAFPAGTNVQLVEVRSRKALRLEIWERGAGRTLSSGSSACAAVAACHRRGLVDRDVAVTMPGGALAVAIEDDGELRLRGPVEEICAVELSADLLRRIERGA